VYKKYIINIYGFGYNLKLYNSLILTIGSFLLLSTAFGRTLLLLVFFHSLAWIDLAHLQREFRLLLHRRLWILVSQSDTSKYLSSCGPFGTSLSKDWETENLRLIIVDFWREDYSCWEMRQKHMRKGCSKDASI
jgi:hypothetical protein